MTADLLAFLKARIDEDERAAKGLTNAARHLDREPDFYGVGGPAALALWQRFNPTRILAEVTAKRQLIAAVNALDKDGDIFLAIGTYLDTDAIWVALALPYADREGYDQHWAPDPVPVVDAKVPAGAIEAIAHVGRHWLDIELAMARTPSPFNFSTPKREPSPDCYEAPFGWVHSRPSCRCKG